MKDLFNPVRSVMNGKKLKGVTKITMTNVHTGKEKVSIDENWVTNGLEAILQDNVSGLADYTKLLPIRSMFSGVLLFGETLAANGYILPTEDVAPIIGHAGDESHSTANPRRGNPNMVETVIGDTSYKGVWTFDTSQAIGTIKSVALCSGVLGNMGPRPWDASYTPYQPINVEAVKTSQGTVWSRALAMKTPIRMDPILNKTTSIWVNGNTFEEVVCYHDTIYMGISRDIHDFIEQSHRTVNLGADLSGNDRYTVFSTVDYYYVVVPTSQKILTIYKIAKVDFSLTSTTAECTDAIFYNSQINLAFKSCPAYPHTETHFWWPSIDRTTFYKIPFTGGGIVGTAEQVTLTPSATCHMSPVRFSDKLILGENFLFNYDTFYPIAKMPIPAGMNDVTQQAWANLQYEAVSAVFGHNSGSGGKTALGLANHNLWLGTKNNLDEQKVKDASTVMKVEYTLSEQ